MCARPSNFKDDPLDAAIRSSPCFAEYKALEECLVVTDRNFKKCQEQIKLLRACSLVAQKGKQE